MFGGNKGAIHWFAVEPSATVYSMAPFPFGERIVLTRPIVEPYKWLNRMLLVAVTPLGFNFTQRNHSTAP
jgi:hypothetical protein